MNKTMTNTTGRVPFKRMVGYGIGGMGEGIGYAMFLSFFIFFLTTVVGIRPLVAGSIATFATLWDGLNDPLIGTWSDRTKNRYGRRRPFIIVGAIVSAISLALMFLNVQLADGLKVVYYVVLCFIFWGFFTSCIVPFVALGSELTEDYNERTKVRAYCTFFMNIGMLIATSAVLLLVSFFERITGSTDMGWLCVGIIFGILLMLSYLIAARTMKGVEQPNPNLVGEVAFQRKGFKVILLDYWNALQNTPLLTVGIIAFIVNIVLGLGSALRVYVFTLYYAYSDAQTSFMFLILGSLTIVAVPVVTFLAKRLGKKQYMVAAMACYGLGHLVIWILPVSDIAMYTHAVLASLGNASFWTLIYSMTYDTTMIAEYKTGQNPTGVYVAVVGLMLLLGSSVGTFITGVGLEAIGFDSAVAMQSASTINGIAFLYGAVCALFCAMAAIVAASYKLTESKYNLLKIAVEKKQNNEQHDIHGLEKLLKISA